ncbi:MAG: hypothetical protein ACPG4Y_08280 [Chitinophagales bacterium]
MKNVKNLASFEGAKIKNLTAVKGGGWIIEDDVIPSWIIEDDVMPIAWTMEDQLIPVKRRTASSSK